MHYYKLALTLLDLAVKFQSLINSTASTMYWRMQSRARVRDWKKQNVTSVDGVTKVMRCKGIGGNSYPKGQIVGSFVWFTAKTDPASCIDGHELKTEKEYWIWRKYNCRTAAVTWQIRRFYADCRNIMHLSAAIPGGVTLGTYGGIARDFPAFVANVWPRTGPLDRFCTSEARYTGKDPRDL